MYHAIALLLLARFYLHAPVRAYRVAALAFGGGILLFSGSLYLLAITHVRAFGMVTPVGGAAFIAGWVALAAGAQRR